MILVVDIVKCADKKLSVGRVVSPYAPQRIPNSGWILLDFILLADTNRRFQDIAFTCVAARVPSVRC